jgi:hypothetical protein
MSSDDRHRAAVESSLQRAREAADRGDYADAIAWVQVVQATGEEIPHQDQLQYQTWRDALATTQGSG